MNIDIEKLRDWVDDSMIEILRACEIKAVNCDECSASEDLTCMCCTHNKGSENHFKPKRNELNNLFIGAPDDEI